MAKIATGSWEMRRRLAAREPFETYGALRAVAGAMDGAWGPGRLPEPWRTQYITAWRDNAITYTVISYQTPIAWVLDTGEVVIPDAKYSITTSKHQGYLYALGQPAEGALADAAARERQTARERAARNRDMAAQGYRRVGVDAYERPAVTLARRPAATLAERTGLEPLPTPAPAFRDDPNASLEDRIAALEATTFAQLDSATTVLERSRRALRDHRVLEAQVIRDQF